MPGPIEIRAAGSTADIAAVRVLFVAYIGSLGIDLSYQGAEAELAGLPGKYAPPRGTLLLARNAAGDAMGCAALRPLSGGDCEMKRLYVAPEARGHGLGLRLVEAIVGEARRRGYRRLLLDTLPTMAAAQALYRARGFHEIAAYYETPVAGTKFMALEL